MDQNNSIVVEIVKCRIEDAQTEKELAWFGGELAILLAEVVRRQIQLENSVAARSMSKKKIYLVRD